MKFNELFKADKPLDNKPDDTKLDLFTENKICDESSAFYDGNYAFDRQQWLKNADLSTLELLSNLYKSGSGKYSKENVAKVLSVLEDFKMNHDLNIKYITGKIPQTRLNLFPPTIRQKIIDDIINGKLPEYDEKYFEKCVVGGKTALNKIKYTTKRDREMKLTVENAQRERVRLFKEGMSGKGETLSTECQMLAIETHAEKGFEGMLEAVDDALPKEINRRLLRVKYEEGISAMTNESRVEFMDDYEETADRSGEISQEFLKQFIQNGENASFILTGGNLRGCLSFSLESIIKSIENSGLTKADMHIPLDKTYDNDSYDEMNGRFPTDMLLSRPRLFVEVYKDGVLIDVSQSEAENRKRVRLYFWSKLSEMSEKLENSVKVNKNKSE